MDDARLRAAAAAGDVPRLRECAAKTAARVHSQDEYGRSALFLAAEGGHADAVHALLELGAKATQTAHGGWLAAAAAAAAGHAEIASRLWAACLASEHKTFGHLKPLLHKALAAHEAVPLAPVDAARDGAAADGAAGGAAGLGSMPSLPLGHVPSATTLLGYDLVTDLGPAHPGAGTLVLDAALPPACIDALVQLWRGLPVAPKDKPSPIDRGYYCDVDGWLCAALDAALVAAGLLPADEAASRGGPRIQRVTAQEQRLSKPAPAAPRPPPPDFSACSLAAKRGDLEEMRRLRRQGAPWSAEVCQAAAWGGHVHVLEWARRHGCPWDWDAVLEGAASGKRAALAEWAEAERSEPLHTPRFIDTDFCTRAEYEAVWGRGRAIEFAAGATPVESPAAPPLHRLPAPAALPPPPSPQSWLQAAAALFTATVRCLQGSPAAAAPPAPTASPPTSVLPTPPAAVVALASAAVAAAPPPPTPPPPAPPPTRHGTLPLMRFLHYPSPGGSLPAHVDLPRVVDGGARTTHSFLLYLTDCELGGETLLLEAKPGDAKLVGAGGVAAGERQTLARSAPRRGRLLLMPHACPHSAAPVISAPKLLIRGEMLLPVAAKEAEPKKTTKKVHAMLQHR